MLWYCSKNHMTTPEFRTSFYSETQKFRPTTVRTFQWWHGKVSSTRTYSPLLLWAHFCYAVKTSEKYSAASILLKSLGREDTQHVGNVDSKVHLKCVSNRLRGWIFKLSELSQIKLVPSTAILSAISSVKIISPLRWNGTIPCWPQSSCKN